LTGQRCKGCREGGCQDGSLWDAIFEASKPARLLLPVVRLKLRLPTISMIMQTMCHQAAFAVACRWGRDAIQCRRLLWQTQLQPSS